MAINSQWNPLVVLMAVEIPNRLDTTAILLCNNTSSNSIHLRFSLGGHLSFFKCQDLDPCESDGISCKINNNKSTRDRIPIVFRASSSLERIFKSLWQMAKTLERVLALFIYPVIYSKLLDRFNQKI